MQQFPKDIKNTRVSYILFFACLVLFIPLGIISSLDVCKWTVLTILLLGILGMVFTIIMELCAQQAHYSTFNQIIIYAGYFYCVAYLIFMVISIIAGTHIIKGA